MSRNRVFKNARSIGNMPDFSDSIGQSDINDKNRMRPYSSGSSFDLSNPPLDRNDKNRMSPYSSGSYIDLSKIQSDSEQSGSKIGKSSSTRNIKDISFTKNDSNKSIRSNTDVSSNYMGNNSQISSRSSSTKEIISGSIWSGEDISPKSKIPVEGTKFPLPKYETHHSESHDNFSKHKKSNSSSNFEEYILQNEVSPLIFNGQIIRYNVRRGVSYKTPILFGSRKVTGIDQENGYRSSHFIFNPEIGTLAAGYDIDNGWKNLPKFSMLTGIGNSSNLDASFISGSYNTIKSQGLLDNSCSSNDRCFIPPSYAIVGGYNNNINSNSNDIDQGSSAIIGSSNVRINNCKDTVFLGFNGINTETTFDGFKEATITRNLFALGKIHSGPYENDPLPVGTVFSANGDVLVKGNIDSQSISTNNLIAENASISNLKLTDIYFKGSAGTTGTFIINPTDNYNVVYVNPVDGPVNIYLGTGMNNIFSSNRTITFKDVTLEVASSSANNVNIIVPNPSGVTGMIPVRIEYYNKGIGLTAGTDAGYVISTSGGSVTLRFATLPIPGNIPTWVIESQFIGNSRTLSCSGLVLPPFKNGIHPNIQSK
jgi:hypothetical protein